MNRRERSTVRQRSGRLALLGLGLVLGAGAWAFLVGRTEPSPAVVRVAPAADLARGASVAGLQRHLDDAGDDWQAWARLGLAYVEEARISGNAALYPKAEGAFDRSLALHPHGNPAALLGRGALANARHDFAAGLRWGDKARDAAPDYAPAYGVVGDALVELGRYDEAFEAYQRMVDLSPGQASYTRAAYALDLQGDAAGATRTLELALGEAISPKDMAFGHHSLGELAWNTGDPDGALARYQQAIRLDPGAVASQAGLARALAATGRPDEAAAQWRSVVEKAPLPEYVAEFGNLELGLGRAEEAEAQFALLAVQRRLLRANGVNIDLELALFSADHGVDLESGLRAAQAEWRRRQSVHVADALAWQLQANGRSAEALAMADQALRLGTRNALFHYHRGMIQRSLGHPAEARADLETALAINPHFSPLGARRAAAVLAELPR